MHYGESLGLDRVYERIKAHETRHGAQWKPAALLERLASSKSRFDRP
jgi:3-hydroxyacyl-CoA dehydrogenase